jgi:hypothetical protein
VRGSYHTTEQHASGAFAQNGAVTLVITGERTNLKNFWSGRWTSTWTIKKDGGACTLAGEIKVTLFDTVNNVICLFLCYRCYLDSCPLL